MSLVAIAVLLLGAALGYANGANDVSKGVATLAGSGVTDLRRAVLWGAAWTAAGGLLAAGSSGALAATFGQGLLAAGTTPSFPAALAVLVGTAAWVLIATRAALPVSTTHALVGALAGVGAVAYGVGAVRWDALLTKVALPLLLSPAAALLLTRLALGLQRAVERRTGVPTDCLCAGVAPAPAAIQRASRSAAAAVPSLSVTVGSATACAAHVPAAARVTLDHLHWLTSGAASLARGLNDAPKLAGVLLAAAALSGLAPDRALAFAVVTAATVAGSVVSGLRVARVLATEVVPLDHRGGFWANAVTAALVGGGAVAGLPMSTTHVSASAIVATGAGKPRGTVNRRAVRDLLSAWVVTAPAAAALGIAAYALARPWSG